VGAMLGRPVNAAEVNFFLFLFFWFFISFFILFLSYNSKYFQILIFCKI
jgi:hypothetical protein